MVAVCHYGLCGIEDRLWPSAFEDELLLFQTVFTQGGRRFLIATPSTLALTLTSRPPSILAQKIHKGAGAPVPSPVVEDVIILVLGCRNGLGKRRLVTKQEWAWVC